MVYLYSMYQWYGIWWDLSDSFVITQGDFADYADIADIFNTLMASLCVMCAGLAAGLTMGLLSLDITKLEIKCRVGTEEEKAAAQACIPVIRRHHLLLVTLLLFNSIANETLPIFLGELLPNYLAIVFAVFLILIFGEILPSAFFTGNNQLRTAARLIPFVHFLTFILYPVAFPISKLLDKWFGEDESTATMTRTELEALVLMQKQPIIEHQNTSITENNTTTFESPSVPRPPTRISISDSPAMNDKMHKLGSANLDLETGLPASYQQDSSLPPTINTTLREEEVTMKRTDDEGLSPSEVTLMLGVLNLSRLTVGNAMIPIEEVYMVSSSHRLDDRQCLHNLFNSGFSRVPVFYRNNRQHLMGYMLVKELIITHKNAWIENIPLREPLFVRPDIGLLEMLGIFQEGQCHLAVVSRDPSCAVQHLRAGLAPPPHAVILGIVTLEDVLEDVIQGDITDETDLGVHRSVSSAMNSTALVRNIAHTPTGSSSGTTSGRMHRAQTASNIIFRTTSKTSTPLSGGEDVVYGDDHDPFYADPSLRRVGSVSEKASGERRRGRSAGRASTGGVSLSTRGSSRDRNRDSSSGNLLFLANSVNAVAGDVRHKSRKSFSPSKRVMQAPIIDHITTQEDEGDYDRGNMSSAGTSQSATPVGSTHVSPRAAAVSFAPPQRRSQQQQPLSPAGSDRKGQSQQPARTQPPLPVTRQQSSDDEDYANHHVINVTEDTHLLLDDRPFKYTTNEKYNAK